MLMVLDLWLILLEKLLEILIDPLLLINIWIILPVPEFLYLDSLKFDITNGVAVPLYSRLAFQVIAGSLPPCV